mmetsp:Transcript_35326/g.113566  ORF Transcript_35326/g.113566 Transcript_35326/m.113566 type:complete len:240 (+) Transcript_35326:1930-2649(+)
MAAAARPMLGWTRPALAPRSSSVRTTSTWPWKAARWRAEPPRGSVASGAAPASSKAAAAAERPRRAASISGVQPCSSRASREAPAATRGGTSAAPRGPCAAAMRRVRPDASTASMLRPCWRRYASTASTSPDAAAARTFSGSCVLSAAPQPPPWACAWACACESLPSGGGSSQRDSLVTGWNQYVSPFGVFALRHATSDGSGGGGTSIVPIASADAAKAGCPSSCGAASRMHWPESFGA